MQAGLYFFPENDKPNEIYFHIITYFIKKNVLEFIRYDGLIF